jgi:hypothetical protein
VSHRKVSWVYVPVVLSIALIVVTLAGCASLPQFNHGAEATFQAAHLLDIIQSEKGAASDPCFTGVHPDHMGVAAWGVGYGLLHYGVTRWLTSTGHPRLTAAWEALTIADTGYAVAHNYQVGIRIGAPNHDDAACLAYYHGHVPQ